MYNLQKDAKKPGQKPRNCGNYSLTKYAQHDTMIIHTVILCLSMGTPPNMDILPQERAVVKKEVE